MSSLVIDNIGQLITNDPALGDGPPGKVKNASLIFENGKVAAVGPAGADADERFDAEGRCVIPGFVDSHPTEATSRGSAGPAVPPAGRTLARGPPGPAAP